MTPLSLHQKCWKTLPSAFVGSIMPDMLSWLPYQLLSSSAYEYLFEEYLPAYSVTGGSIWYQNTYIFINKTKMPKKATSRWLAPKMIGMARGTTYELTCRVYNRYAGAVQNLRPIINSGPTPNKINKVSLIT